MYFLQKIFVRTEQAKDSALFLAMERQQQAMYDDDVESEADREQKMVLSAIDDVAFRLKAMRTYDQRSAGQLAIQDPTLRLSREALTV